MRSAARSFASSADTPATAPTRSRGSGPSLGVRAARMSEFPQTHEVLSSGEVDVEPVQEAATENRGRVGQDRAGDLGLSEISGCDRRIEERGVYRASVRHLEDHHGFPLLGGEALRERGWEHAEVGPGIDKGRHADDPVPPEADPDADHRRGRDYVSRIEVPERLH